MKLFHRIQGNELMPERSGMFIREDRGDWFEVELLLVFIAPWRREFLVDFGRRRVLAHSMYWLRLSFTRDDRRLRLHRGSEWSTADQEALP